MPEQLFARYEIRRELGRGAMGVVYEAHDPQRGVDVALKVMSIPPSASEEKRKFLVERFYQEARTLSELSHFHIVRVFDQGECEGRYFLSMELARGTTLRDRLQFQGPLSYAELVRLALEMCSALEHVHSRGVVHRDIKPENIMLLPDGRSKLMDFGIARMTLEEGAHQAGFQGSPAYMSPEQVAGAPVDGRSDIYSLAVTLYEAATGRRAFEGDSVPAIVNRVIQEYPAPPAGLPLYFQGILMRAMAKDPGQRYATAGDMAADLRTGRMPSGTFSPVQTSGPGTAVLQPDMRCALHPALPPVGTCTACSRIICNACMLEVPKRGLVCRNCAFGKRR